MVGNLTARRLAPVVADEDGGRRYRLQAKDDPEWREYLVSPQIPISCAVPEAPGKNGCMEVEVGDGDVAVTEETVVKFGMRVKVLFDKVDDDEVNI